MAEGDPKPAFSPEQGEELNKLLGATVNNMLTARLKTFEKQLHDKLGATMGESLKAQLPELLKELRPAVDPEDGGGKGKRGKVEDVEAATLRKQIEEQRVQMQLISDRLNAEREKNVAASIQGRTSDLLAAAGIEGQRFKAAYAYLQHTGRIVRSEDPDSEDVFYNDDAQGQIDFAQGLKGWLKSEEAKIFLPPTGARGAGTRPPTNPQQPQNGTDASSVRKSLADALDRAIG